RPHNESYHQPSASEPILPRRVEMLVSDPQTNTLGITIQGIHGFHAKIVGKVSCALNNTPTTKKCMSNLSVPSSIGTLRSFHDSIGAQQHQYFAQSCKVHRRRDFGHLIKTIVARIDGDYAPH